MPTPLMSIVLSAVSKQWHDGGKAAAKKKSTRFSKFNSVNIDALPDTGTSKTIVHIDTFRRLDGIKIDRSKSIRCTTANGGFLSIEGTARLYLRYHDHEAYVDALIANDLHETMLVSWVDLINLNVISPDFPAPLDYYTFTTIVEPVKDEEIKEQILKGKDELIEEYSDVFNDEVLTPMAGEPMHIHLDRFSNEYKPLRICTARTVPVHLAKEAEKTMEWFVKSGVVQKVEGNEFSEWCSPAFFVKKPNGKVRLVVDYREINKYIQRPVHPFPSPRDIIKQINPDSRYFMKLDALQGYYQLPLDEESSKLTTFLLPSGRYRFLRAPMGMNSSSDGFCFRTDEILRAVPDLLKIVDDALLQAATYDELMRKFELMLQCCRKGNLTLSKSKIEIGTKINFAGYIISDTGVEPDPNRLKAISEFPRPKDISELRGFLGLANQLGNFVPDLAHMSEILRQLLKKNNAYLWLDEHEQAFQEMKRLLTSPAIVKPFKPNLPIELLTDASRLKGLGYALLQRDADGHPIMIQCGSRSLNSAETRYATNELECLAIQWAIQDCKYYLLGCNFTVITDHRPLVGTFDKPLADLSNARLLRFREKLLDYRFKVIWSPGKTHCIADALSRSPVFQPPELQPAEKNEEETVQLCTYDIRTECGERKDLLQRIKDAAAKDDQYQKVIQALKEGISLKQVHPQHPARLYKAVWDDMSISDDLILVDGSRIVVPTDLRSQILKDLHYSHVGINRMKMAARRHFYWPFLTRDITKLIENCSDCQKLRPSQAHEPWQSLPPAPAPMCTVVMDLFEYGGKHYIVMCDHYSLYTWLEKLNKLSTASITNVLTRWFRDFGYPREIISDNGPQFRQDFKIFCADNGITHNTSSPYNPTSNGLAEAAVKNAKYLLMKSRNFGEFIDRLTHWKNMPSANDTLSPCEKFFGRLQRHPKLPLATISPTYDNTKAEKYKNAAKDKTIKTRQKNDLERNTSRKHSRFSLPQLIIGQPVLIQNPLTKRWASRGIIIDIRSTGRSYLVEREDGRTYVRSRRLLKPIKQIFETQKNKYETRVKRKDESKLRNTRPRKNALICDRDSNCQSQRRSGRQTRAPDRLVVRSIGH